MAKKIDSDSQAAASGARRANDAAQATRRVTRSASTGRYVTRSSASGKIVPLPPARSRTYNDAELAERVQNDLARLDDALRQLREA